MSRIHRSSIGLGWFRLGTASLTLLAFTSSTLAPAVAWAQEAPAAPDVSVENWSAEGVDAKVDALDGTTRADALGADGDEIERSSPEATPQANAPAGHGQGAPGAARADGKSDAVSDAETKDPAGGSEIGSQAVPTGGDKSGVTSQAISMPKGSGTIQGMGESFSAQLSTGIATFNVPFTIPAARGGAQASLGLSYSSASGAGLAGVGWDVGVPFIARQSDRGLPKYDDRAAWHPEQDRFVFNGGQELVPICVVTVARECANALTGEVMPPWSAGHQYFRARVEGSFLRFFWSPDHLTWRVQDKSGVTMELGAPLDGSGDTNALVRNPDRQSEIYKWSLVRQYDTYGDANPATGNPTPTNVVVYKYLQDGGNFYVSDIFHTTPAATPTTTDVSKFAHHVRLVYEHRSDPTESYRSGWKLEQRLRLARVDVASKSFSGAVTEARRQVRRYHLKYATEWHQSLLESVQVEGRCSGSENGAPAEDGAQELPPTTGCDRLPPMTFGYSHVSPFKADGSASSADLPGFEGFDERLIPLDGSPPHSIDDALADFFDIDSDGLPDLLVTAPGMYNDDHAVFFNGHDGVANRFGAATHLGIKGVLGADANTLKLSNPNVVALDLDADGKINLLHMPAVKSYAVYSPEFVKGDWKWVGRTVSTASGQSPKIDFGKDTLEKRVVDVNFDGLVDLVESTGTEYHTFFSLGRYAGGDGQFGKGTWAGATTANLSNDPVATCVPWSSTPVRFGDKEIQLAEMNGDGIPDIVRLRRGDVRYWPGRGNGVWGTGGRNDCPAGSFSSNRYVEMDTSPFYSDIEGTTLRVDDVNGDGLDDLVQVRFDAVDIWLNVDGKGWTEDRHTVEGTPPSPSFAERVRLVDINGSGARDILWGDSANYRYIDLAGGARPGVLVRVENGLGKSTDLEYSSSAAEKIAFDAFGGACDAGDKAWSSPWCSQMPMVTHVVKRVTERDNLDVASQGERKYVTEYQYRDPVYDGQQREFRGFRKARSLRIGDSNSPTDITDTTFLLGECDDETTSALGNDNGRDDCSPAERWRDNPKEALKGLPVLTERYDENGVYLSSGNQKYTLRELYQGLDGRSVRHAFQSGTTNFLYDTSPYVSSPGVAADLPVVDLEKTPGTVILEARKSILFGPRSTANYAKIESLAVVDAFGNQVSSQALGCKGGSACPASGTPGMAPDEVITHVTEPALVAGNETGWLWRTVRSYALGSVHTEVRGDTRTTFNTKGDPTKTSAYLKGTVLLDRFHAASGAVAPVPDTVSYNDLLIDQSSRSYDPQLGLPTGETGANGRCRSVSYDSDSTYKTFPTGETIYTNGCGSGGLTTIAMYDRGLGAVTTAIDMQGQPTAVTYDGFGRLISLTRPHPTQVGTLSPIPSVLVEYFLPSPENGLKYSRMHTKTQDGAAPSDAEYQESWAYVDGFGRTLVTLTEADPAAGDGGAWVAGSFLEYDAKSAVRKKFLPYFYNGAVDAFPISAPVETPYGRQRYDAFGRAIQTFDLDGTVTLKSAYHALSTDLWDAADLEPGPHQSTPASERKDGHGRTIAVTERIRVNGVIEERDTRTQYLATGEPEKITRWRVNKSDPPVVRWMRYDTLGRMVLNVEPNTSKNFTEDVTVSATPSSNGLKAWRYAYNDAGDLVGTSDARGCGVNFQYDGAGRLLREDYSPCEAHHLPYSPPVFDTTVGPLGLEVLYHYDSAPSAPYPGLNRPSELNIPEAEQPFFRGRLAAVWDRGSATWTRYDGRGRVIQTTVAAAKPLTAPPQDGDPDSVTSLAARYTSDSSVKSFAFDAADREVASSTGAETPEFSGAEVTVLPSWFSTQQKKTVVSTEYTRRGTVKNAGGSYGSLVASVERTADGLVTELVYGDAAGTTTSSSYDNRRRLRSVQTYRGPPPSGIWSSPPPNYLPAPAPSGTPNTFQLLLQDEDYSYDVVNNPTEIRDWRLAEEWPAGAKPVTKKIEYDDLYRVTRVGYEYPGGDDAWTSPFAAENDTDASNHDPRRAKPSPHVDFAKRIQWQSFQYDWLGNTQKTDDDAKGFYDRSLGTITNRTSGGNAAKPYQLQSAIQPSGTRNGQLATLYDDAGNLTRLDVKRAGPCLPAGAQCSQRLDYRWDEVGRLVRARRWDVAAASITAPDAALPGTTAAADLNYTYDAGDQRTIKTAFDGAGVASHTVYFFDSLELRRATFTGTDYSRNKDTEVGYLSAHGMRLGRLVYEDPDVPTIGAARLHVFLELGDHLGSTSIVIDKVTSELVERGTYQAYGGTESNYRPERWKGFREDYRFTGKEEDVEVGLQYFGKRFLNPLLGRWMSADPLTVHGLSADSNLYAYVSGSPLKNVDPLGLEKDAAGNRVGHSVSEEEYNRQVAEANATSIPNPAENVGVQNSYGCFINAQAARAAAPPGVDPEIAPATPSSALEDRTRDHGEITEPQGPSMEERLRLATLTTPFAPLTVSLYAATGNHDAFALSQAIAEFGTEMLFVQAASADFKLTMNSMPAYRSEAATMPDSGLYIPKSPEGGVIPLAQQRLNNGTQVPLPLPEAEGRPHTALGGRVGTSDGITYRQSATFPGGTWPSANGHDVPWGRVDWYNHGRSDHPDPHMHPFVFDSSQGGWIEGPRMKFNF